MMHSVMVICFCLFQTLAGQPSTSRSAHTPKRQKHAVSRPVGADATATKALATLKSMITDANYRQFGLASVADAQALQLGNPVPLFYVKAEDLKHYTPGTDAGKLMTNSNRLLYPVVLNGSGRLLITIEQFSGNWRLVSFGLQDIAPALTQIKTHKVNRLNAGPGAFEQNYFAVQVPAMHLTFLALAPEPGPGGNAADKRHVVLTPLISKAELSSNIGFSHSDYLLRNPGFSSEKEGTKSADDVFSELKNNASKVTDIKGPQ